VIRGVVVASGRREERPGGTDQATRGLWNTVKRPVYLAAGPATELLTASTTPALRRCIETLRASAGADAWPRSTPEIRDKANWIN
jgi:hypothetical protein